MYYSAGSQRFVSHSRCTKEHCHVRNHFDHRFSVTRAGRTTHLATQQKLGLLSQWRTRFVAGDSAYSVFVGTYLVFIRKLRLKTIEFARLLSSPATVFSREVNKHAITARGTGSDRGWCFTLAYQPIHPDGRIN
jgi:hypothetical protein